MLATWNAFQTGVTLVGRDPLRLFAVGDTVHDQISLSSLIARSGIDTDIIEAPLHGDWSNLCKARVDVIIHAACSYDAANSFINNVALPLALPLISIADVPIIGVQDKICASKVTRLFKTGLTPELLGSVVLKATREQSTQRGNRSTGVFRHAEVETATIH